MKKLKLNLLNLEGAEVLTRQQLKMVMGGSGDDGDGSEGDNTGGYCCYNKDDCPDKQGWTKGCSPTLTCGLQTRKCLYTRVY